MTHINVRAGVCVYNNQSKPFRGEMPPVNINGPLYIMLLLCLHEPPPPGLSNFYTIIYYYTPTTSAASDDDENLHSTAVWLLHAVYKTYTIILLTCSVRIYLYFYYRINFICH